MTATERFFATADGRTLECCSIAPQNSDASAPPLVFLHEGLGSTSMWKEFPEAVAERAGAATLVYSRYGYGRSDLLESPFAVDYMHREAQLALPQLLDMLEMHDPVLIGHSDGASIALIHAATADRPVRGLVLMAPHVFVEQITVDSIAAAKVAFETTDLPDRLGKYHADVRRTFYGWNDIWLNPAFRDWSITELLPQVSCPVLTIQGADDEYGTLAQIEAILGGVAGVARSVVLPDCGHSPHRDQPIMTLAAIGEFLDGIKTGAGDAFLAGRLETG